MLVSIMMSLSRTVVGPMMIFVSGMTLNARDMRGAAVSAVVRSIVSVLATGPSVCCWAWSWW